MASAPTTSPVVGASMATDAQTVGHSFGSYPAGANHSPRPCELQPQLARASTLESDPGRFVTRLAARRRARAVFTMSIRPHG